MHEYTIGKPQLHRPGKWRCSIGREGRRTWGPLANSPEAATRAAERAAQAAAGGVITVQQAIDAFAEFRLGNGWRGRSLTTATQQARRFFEPALLQPLVRITPKRASELYERIRTVPGSSGVVLSVATQRHCLEMARALFAWCVAQKLARSNPLAELRGVGIAHRGKHQLRLDEARQLVQLAFQQARDGHDGSLAVLMALVMGMRAGEIVSRSVRDLDDGGRLLWIDDVDGWRTKSRAARRSLRVPDALLPLLWRRAVDKQATDKLFPSPCTGGQRMVSWVRTNTARLCKEAGLPRVCAHSLRGLHATIAIRAGASPGVVAQALGHEAPSMTLSAYAAPGSVEAGYQSIAESQLLREPGHLN